MPRPVETGPSASCGAVRPGDRDRQTAVAGGPHGVAGDALAVRRGAVPNRNQHIHAAEHILGCRVGIADRCVEGQHAHRGGPADQAFAILAVVRFDLAFPQSDAGRTTSSSPPSSSTPVGGATTWRRASGANSQPSKTQPYQFWLLPGPVIRSALRPATDADQVSGLGLPDGEAPVAEVDTDTVADRPRRGAAVQPSEQRGLGWVDPEQHGAHRGVFPDYQSGS